MTTQAALQKMKTTELINSTRSKILDMDTTIEELLETKRLNKLIITTVKTGLIAVDNKRAIIMINPEGINQLGINCTQEQLVGMDWSSLVCIKDVDKVIKQVENTTTSSGYSPDLIVKTDNRRTLRMNWSKTKDNPAIFVASFWCISK